MGAYCLCSGSSSSLFTFCIISGIKSVIFTDSFHLLLASCTCARLRLGRRTSPFVLWMLFTFRLRVSARFCASFRIRMGKEGARARERERESIFRGILHHFSVPRFFLVRKRKSTVDLAPPQPRPHNIAAGGEGGNAETIQFCVFIFFFLFKEISTFSS